jgi:hypothetical protein
MGVARVWFEERGSALAGSENLSSFKHELVDTGAGVISATAPNSKEKSTRQARRDASG